MPAAHDDFLALRGPTPGDPAGSARLVEIFAADSARERARGLRLLVLHVLALASLPLGLVAARPAWPSAGLRAFAVAGWGSGIGALLLAVAWEARCAQRRASCVAKLGPLPQLSRRARAEACAGPPDEES